MNCGGVHRPGAQPCARPGLDDATIAHPWSRDPRGPARIPGEELLLGMLLRRLMLWRRLPLRSSLALWSCLALLRRLALLCLPLLTRLALLLLLNSLTLLLLLNTLALLLNTLVLLLLLNRLTLLLGCLMLLLNNLTLLLLLGRLVLLLNSLTLLLCLPLLTRLVLLLLLNRLTLLLLLGRLVLLLNSLIVHLHGRRDSHVAIGRKRPVDSQIGWTAVVHAGKLSPVGAGGALIHDLRPHGRGMSFMTSRQFRGPGSHLEPARSAVEAHTSAAAVVIAHGAVVNVMHA